MADLPENVKQFLERAAAAYGKYKADEFSQSMWSECCRIKSPIEQLFMAAIHLVSEVNLLRPVLVASFENIGDDLQIIPQWKAGKYLVDFALHNFRRGKPIVCVELDGHDFHDRDERQRRYEKTRDRFLVAEGHSVLHFTGAEIVKDPCAAALEAFNVATGLSDAAIHPFDIYGTD